MERPCEKKGTGRTPHTFLNFHEKWLTEFL